MRIILQSLLGGGLIGASAAGLLLVNGRIAGVSGVLADATASKPGPWRWGFLAGLAATGLAAGQLGIAVPAAFHDQSFWALGLAGLLVGVGTRLGSGCTSGHGVCGLANLSPRSLAATLVFMSVAGAVVFATHHLEPVRQLLTRTGLS
jgi:uncharacterized membrane protein YedE/YeeE